MVQQKMSDAERLRRDAACVYGENPMLMAEVPSFEDWKYCVRQRKYIRYRNHLVYTVLGFALLVGVGWSISIDEATSIKAVAPVRDVAFSVHVPNVQSAQMNFSADIVAELPQDKLCSPQDLSPCPSEELPALQPKSWQTMLLPRAQPDYMNFHGELLFIDGYKLRLESPAEDEESYWVAGLPPSSEHYRSIHWIERPKSESNLLTRACNAMSNKDFEAALELWNHKLTMDPLNVNALFYSGYCAYQLQRDSLALSQWSSLLFRRDSPFSEETLWYRALALERTGCIEDAGACFEEITGANGWYSQQAKLKLLR
jgi:tetratricopeptide (TPR) repeat protein